MHHVCGIQEIEPEIDIGVELGEEWRMAERLGGEVEESRGSAA